MNSLEHLLSRLHSYNIGALILRLTIGILMLAHGILILRNGIGNIEAIIVGHGLPKFFAYGAYLGNLIAPIFLIIGLWTRFWALIIFCMMLFIVLVLFPNLLFTLGKHGIRLQLHYLYLFGSLTIFFIGGGAFSAKS